MKKILLTSLLGLSLSGCNIFDHKIQGQIGNSAGSVGSDKPKLSERIGLAAADSEYLFDEGTRQDIEIKFSKALIKDTTFNWSIDGGADDFNVNTGSVEVKAGETSFTISLVAMNDGLYEGEEKFNLVVDVDEDYFAADLVVPLRISEKAATPPKISFTSAGGTVNEATGTWTVTLNLSQPTATLNAVALTTSGSATFETDYKMSPPRELVFSPGETSKTIKVAIVDDAVANEGLEEATITLDHVVLGSASIDPANSSHSVLIEDNDSPTSPISITGVTGGADVTTDFFLTAGNHPVVRWTAPSLTDETGFDVTIYESNGVGIRCPTMTRGVDATFADFSTCNLVEGGTYKISVVANTVGGTAVTAQNNMVPFTVDTVPPGTFSILGVLGGNDISPDGYLAGSLTPTVAWTDADGETSYDIKVLSSAGASINVANCEVTNVPANTTSFAFENCTLTANLTYRARVTAKDNSGQSTTAADYSFFVTQNQSGYLVLGVTGGTNDTTADENMDDGDAPRVHWQKSLNADRYRIKIRNNLNTVTVCALPGDGTVGGNLSEIAFDPSTCKLDLHELYKVVVETKTAVGPWVEAANSPYTFRYRVGLYIDGTGGSYLNGTTITTCGGGGGDVCDKNTPYEATTRVQVPKIRISNNGVLAGAAWTGNVPTSGNGVLNIETDYLTLDSTGKISMTGRGYSAGLGPGAGTSGTLGNGASHGGQGGLTPSGAQGAVYGDVLNPDTMGSGGGNGGSGTKGGAGGGVINITVNKILNLNGSTVRIESNGGSGQVTGCSVIPNSQCPSGGGGGAGGSININAEEVRGLSGAKIVAAGGGNDAIGLTRNSKASAGGGGRIAFRYSVTNIDPNIVLDASGTRTDINNQATSSSAAGTVFYRNLSDATKPSGFLVVGQSDATIPHVQGVETPIPIGITFDGIKTVNNGTLIIPGTDIYVHPKNFINFRLVVAGDLQLTNGGGPNELIIGEDEANPGMIEWRRSDAVVYDKLTIRKNSLMTHSRNGSAAVYRLVLNIPTIEIVGRVDVTGRGFGLGYGPGRATGTYGASYGGQGGIGNTGNRQSIYGNFTSPVELGSGGSTASVDNADLGFGGGSVEINTNTLTLKGEASGGVKVAGTGTIKADGNAGTYSGGSGGSIKIVAKQVYGFYGTLSANGGSSTGGAGGSGGRIAVFYERDEEFGNPAPKTIWETTINSSLVELTSKGGAGGSCGPCGTSGIAGAAGSMYLKKTKQDLTTPPLDEAVDAYGHLWVFNAPRIYDERVTTVLIDSLPLDSIKTDTSGTVQIPAGMTILLPTNTIDYRIVVEGDYTNPNPPNLTIGSGGYVEWRKASPLMVAGGGIFTVDTGGVLTHSKNSTTRQYVINVIADYLVLKGTIDARGKGYGVQSGPGATALRYGGAAHAGTGSDDQSPRLGSGAPYGMTAVKAPIDLGSGGYCANGGGSIRLQITQRLDFIGGTAKIDASGPDVASTCVLTGTPFNDAGAGGASSGGSIYITAKEVTGPVATIDASGGTGHSWLISSTPGVWSTGYSGSGGRIAIVVEKDAVTPAGLLQGIVDRKVKSIGGPGEPGLAAAAGTIYIKRDKDSSNVAYPKKESLYLHNDGLTYFDRIETPIPDAPADGYDEIVTLGNATLIVTNSQMFHLKPEFLKARLVVEGIFTVENSNLTIESGGYLQWRRNTPLVLNTLEVKSGGVLTHTSNFNDAAYRLELDLQNLTLRAGSFLDVTGKGYQSSSGPGGGRSGSNASNSAGAYGGNSRTSLAYGSVSAPFDLGSGGGDNTEYSKVIGGSGGGNIQIRVSGLADISGAIIADGAGSVAAGSGGTISLDVANLKLSSGYELRAKGGAGSFESGTGGRIAILYNSYTQGTAGPATVTAAATSAEINAAGGPGSAGVYGAAGTIYYRDKTVGGSKGNLVVKNNPNPYSETTTPLPDGGSYDSIYVDPKAAVEVRLGESATLPSSTLGYRLVMGGRVQTPGGVLSITNGGTLEVRRGAVVDEFTTLTIENGGTLTHTANNDLKRYWLEILAADINLDSGGKIDATGKGYAKGLGPSPGCIIDNGAIYGGGSHGGFGGSGTMSSCSRMAYGSVKNPLDLGSGGGTGTGGWTSLVGGAGGGLIKLTATNDLTLNGTISADGVEGVCTGINSCGGSGAGGSINIVTKNLKGSVSASLTANGGRRVTGVNEMSSGGGGRIAFKITTADLFNGGAGMSTLPMRARSGDVSSTYAGAAGTIWRSYPGDTTGRLFISNYDSPYVPGAVTELFTNEPFQQIVIGGNAPDASRTGIGVRKSTSFEFQTSDVNFPLLVFGSPKFVGFSGGQLGDLNVKSGGIVEFYGDQPFTFNNIVVDAGGLITHGKNGTSLTNLLKLNAASVRLKNGGVIDVSERGYGSGSGPGAGVSGWMHAGGGGSFGGAGGSKAGEAVANGNVYGTSDLSIFTVGSGGGGGDWGCLGGSGGGGVLLNVGVLEMDYGSMIKANGGQGQNSQSNGNPCKSGGGGSGGAIKILATEFKTSNPSMGSRIEARGGGIQGEGVSDGHGDGGGGGGGRISINYTTGTGLNDANILNWTLRDGGGSEPGDRNGSSGTLRLNNVDY